MRTHRPCGDDGLTGFTVTNANRINLWNEFRRLGGVDVVGWPLTDRFDSWGQTVQVFQNDVLHWNADARSAELGPLPDDLTTAAPEDARTPRPSPLLPSGGATVQGSPRSS